MKYILILILQLPTFLAFSQSEKWSVETEIKSELLKELVSTLETPEFIEMMPEQSEDYLNSFHPIHLNDDEDIDFIYSGFVGAESNGTSIFVNQEGTLKQIEFQLGNIAKITRQFPDSPLVIDFIQSGCCDDPINFWQQWTIHSQTKNISIQKTEEYYFMEGTAIPKTLNAHTKFRIINSSYKLRATPEILDKEPINHHFEHGNLIAEYSEGDTGFALASEIDETGRVWWFVVINKPHDDGYSVYHSKRNRKWLGWMSSRYVEKID